MTNEELQTILRKFDFEEKTLTSFSQPPLACYIGGISADKWVAIAAAIEEKCAPNKALNTALDLLSAETKRADENRAWAMELANKLIASSQGNG